MKGLPVAFRSRLLRSAAPIGAGVVLAAFASLSQAQTSPEAAPANNNTVGEVVVTAQFREQNLQQTPLAITAVNAAMLENRSQTNVFQVAAEAPNVSLRPAGGGFGSAMVAFIRGVGQTDFNFSQEPGVAIYVDDVYYSTLTGSLLDLTDLDRVEILRGPQGTLAGRNAIGGAIKLYSKKPDGAGGGYVEGTYGSLNRIDLKAGADFVVVPDKLFVRVSGASRHHDGYVDRIDYKCTHPASPIRTFMVGTGCKLGEEGGQAFDAAKIAVRWLPTDDIEVNLSADATNDQSPVQAGTLLWARPNGLSLDGVPYSNIFVPYGPNSGDPNHPGNPYMNYATYIDPGPPGGGDHLDAGWKPVAIDPINHYRTWGASGTIDWKLSDHLALKSITSYRKFTNEFAQDTSGSPVGVELLMQTLHHTQWTQEFRANGTVGDTINYTLGAFYAKQTGDEEARVDLPYTGTGAVPGVYNFDFDFKHGPDTSPSTSKAVYGNIDWAVSSQIDVIGGVRYSKDQKTYTYHRHNPDGTDVCATPNFVPGGCPNWLVFGLDGKSSTFQGHRWDYRVDVNYKITDDAMVYAQVSTGYKGGGANARPFYGGPPGPTCAVATCQVTTFNPETLTAYEGGFKTSLLDRRVRFNGAGFINKYKNIILSLGTCPLNTPGGAAGPCAMPQNVGSADVKGLEFETEAHPFGGLEFDGSVSLLDFKYTDTNFAATGVSIDAVPPYSPKWKWNIGVQYAFDLPAGGSITPRVDVAYQSDIFTTATNTPLDQDPSKQVITVDGSGHAVNHPDRISGYALANARITWRNDGGDWQTSLEVTNFTNKLYYTTYFDQAEAVGYLAGQPAMGREWALSVKKTF